MIKRSCVSQAAAHYSSHTHLAVVGGAFPCGSSYRRTEWLSLYLGLWVQFSHKVGLLRRVTIDLLKILGFINFSQLCERDIFQAFPLWVSWSSMTNLQQSNFHDSFPPPMTLLTLFSTLNTDRSAIFNLLTVDHLLVQFSANQPNQPLQCFLIP